MVEMHRGDVDALHSLLALPPRLPTAAFRALAGLDPAPATAGLTDRLRAARPVSLVDGTVIALDLGVASDAIEGGAWRRPGAGAALAAAAGPLVATRWGEIALTAAGMRGPEPRQLQLGVTLHAAPGTPVRAPLPARVMLTQEGLIAHLSELGIDLRLDGLDATIAAGADVAAGTTLGAVTTEPLHIQLVTDPAQPRAGRVRDRAAWQALCPTVGAGRHRARGAAPARQRHRAGESRRRRWPGLGSLLRAPDGDRARMAPVSLRRRRPPVPGHDQQRRGGRAFAPAHRQNRLNASYGC